MSKVKLISRINYYVTMTFRDPWDFTPLLDRTVSSSGRRADLVPVVPLFN